MPPARTQSGFGSFLARAGSGKRKSFQNDQEHAAAIESLKHKLVASGHATLPAALVINGDVDATLLRFLRARKYNVDHAFAMLEKSLAWRVKVGADHILEHPIDPQLQETVRNCRPSSYIGFDKNHHPIFVERLGKLDGKRMEKQGASDDLALSYHLREMEFMAQVVFAEAAAAAGHTVDRVVSVMDAAGLTLGQLTGFAQRLLRLITAMDSDNYPECCHAIYIANGGATFGAIWRLVSPFIDKGTRDKVHVIGGGKNMHRVLAEAIGQEMLPNFLGGSLDYDAVRHEWLDKMDQAIAERQQHPQEQAPIPVLPAAKIQQHPQQTPFAQLQPQPMSFAQLQPQRSSHSGPLQWLRMSRSSVSSDGGDGWATPMSAMSRFSSASGQSVYFDAPDSFLELGSGSSTCSPTGALDGDHLHHHMFGQHKPQGPVSPDAEHAGSVAGSMSVGPQSRTRSQLSQQSGSTGVTLGQGLGHGNPGSLEAGGPMYEQDHEQIGFKQQEQQQPVCGCRCVIS